MVMLTLADAILDKFGGDSLGETRTNLKAYRARIARDPGAVPPGDGIRSGMAGSGEAGSGGDD
jgi:chorismate synthase